DPARHCRETGARPRRSRGAPREPSTRDPGVQRRSRAAAENPRGLRPQEHPVEAGAVVWRRRIVLAAGKAWRGRGRPPHLPVAAGVTLVTLRALIVDDEPVARRRLRTLLESEGTVEVLGECEDGSAAIDDIRRARPDVVFLDVQMPGLDGFDVVDALEPAEQPAIVVVTAYDG